MSAAASIAPASETKWTVLNGSMAGSVRLMKLAAFSIGRSPDCGLVIIDDPKCSRRHAEVRFTAQGCEISSLSDKNLLIINGQEIDRAILNDEDVVVLGNTEIRFNLTSVAVSRASGNTQITLVPRAEALARADQVSQYSDYTSRPIKSTSGNSRRLLIYGIVAVVVVLFIVLPSAKKKAELGLRTESQIQADIETANKMNDAAQNMPNKRIEQSITARQAQENFVRGFRDYRKGQFERSIDSFQACLALDPSHALCNRYIRLAQRRFNELVQYDLVLGRKYRDQSQFEACRSAFRNVMVMVKDPTSPTYREAKANYDACNSLTEDRF